MTLFYVDVSHYDWDRNGGNLNWAQMKSEGGFSIMVARATYGDPSIYAPETRHFREMASAAKEAGLFTGGYHNLIHGDQLSTNRQVDLFHKELDIVGADWAMVDVEPYQTLQQNGLWPTFDDARRFGERFNAVDGKRKLAFYIPRWVWENWLARPMMAQLPGALIASRYSMGTKQGTAQELYAQSGGDAGAGWQPYGGVVPRMWQFSSSALIPGKQGVTDVNAFVGNIDTFKSIVLKPQPVVNKLPTYPNGSRTLELASPKMFGTDVEFIQKFIGTNRCGPADGYFGASTKAGVLWYQEMRGLTKDGIVGPKTWAIMLTKKAAPAKKR